MSAERDPRRPGPELRRRAALLYTLVWAAGGTVAALAIIALIRLVGGPDPTVPLRPVLQPSLDIAVRSAGCRSSEVRRSAADAPGAAPGVHEAALEPDAVAASLYDGLVVIEHRPGADEDTIRELFEAVPEGTVIAPRADLADAVVVHAWLRELRCPRLDAPALDAIQLFRGRFLGRAPDG